MGYFMDRHHLKRRVLSEHDNENNTTVQKNDLHDYDTIESLVLRQIISEGMGQWHRDESFMSRSLEFKESDQSSDKGTNSQDLLQVKTRSSSNSSARLQEDEAQNIAYKDSYEEGSRMVLEESKRELDSAMHHMQWRPLAMVYQWVVRELSLMISGKPIPDGKVRMSWKCVSLAD